MFAPRVLFGYDADMANEERRSPTRAGSLSNSEAAALIEIILANTSTSASPAPKVPDSPKSLADLFPQLALAGA